ncbi:hypothetical protein [Marinimicrobium sp. ARAG 43.8]|uniref:hypothetical protein n=1 Tax=Marinimicrobium sp. ARAG 43.8 TaxID=3418719 RepID=UPI003CEE7793
MAETFAFNRFELNGLFFTGWIKKPEKRLAPQRLMSARVGSIGFVAQTNALKSKVYSE